MLFFIKKKLKNGARASKKIENKSAERGDGCKLLRSLPSEASWIFFLASFAVVCRCTPAGADLFSICLHSPGSHFSSYMHFFIV